MRHVNRLLLYLLLIVGIVRMGLFLAYAALELTLPLEIYHLEAKMIHLAWRIQHGVRFYPEWQDYPYVSNFFGPCYFGIVGLLGRAFGADLMGLLVIGRVVTLTSALLTTALLGLYVGRRYGVGAGLAGAALSVGSFQMYGFAVMNRPDMTAELFGAAGFFLATRPGRVSGVAGGVLLALAILTKQTAAVFLLAAAVALWFEGQRRQAIMMLACVGGGLAGLVAVVTAKVEPNFAASLLGESVMPMQLGYWQFIMDMFARNCPDQIFWPLVGLGIWWVVRPRQVAPLTLTVVLLVVTIAAAAKRGSSVNYFISFRLVAGLAVGALWHLMADPRIGRRFWPAPVLVLGIATLYPSTAHMLAASISSFEQQRFLKSPLGAEMTRLHQRLYEAASDPEMRLLTDYGLLDIHQGERTAYADPWLFRQLVQIGEIDPREMARRVEEGEYDLIVTRHDLFSPSYAGYDMGLPMPVVEPARRRYRLAESWASYYFYERREPDGSVSDHPGAGR